MIVLHPDGFINTDSKECISCGKGADSPYRLLCKECLDDVEDTEFYKEYLQSYQLFNTATDNEI